MKNFRIESLILAIGLLLLGICIQKGFKSFAERDRSVNVKGLAEMEVPLIRSHTTYVQKLRQRLECSIRQYKELK